MNSFNLPLLILIAGATLISLQALLTFWLLQSQKNLRGQADVHHEKLQQAITSQLHHLHIELKQSDQTSQHNIQEKITQGQFSSQQLITATVQQQMNDVREQINHSFKQHANAISVHLQSLTEEIRNHLNSITQQENTRLTEDYEKTSYTFIDVVKR